MSYGRANDLRRALLSDSDRSALEAHDAELLEKRDEEWLMALLDTEHGGSWDTSKLKESAGRYRAQVRDRALEEAASIASNRGTTGVEAGIAIMKLRGSK